MAKNAESTGRRKRPQQHKHSESFWRGAGRPRAPGLCDAGITGQTLPKPKTSGPSGARPPNPGSSL
eukprot:11096680-Lingulodinium_polyedra.AAC.1